MKPDDTRKGRIIMTIRKIQLLLAFLDFYQGAIDGIWGELSAEATVRFQTHVGLEPDGIPGAQTRQALRHGVYYGMADRDPEPADDFWDEIMFFDRKEFQCTCCGRGCNGFPAEPEEQLVRNAESARKHFNRAAIVSSGVRCRLRNSELPGSASNSLHMKGKAMDFCITGVPANQVLDYIRTLPYVDEAYAIDDSFVHMGVLKFDQVKNS